MKVVEGIAELRAWRREQTDVALVPTMGALHDGHVSLVQAARHDHSRVVVSIFVNPTQFGPGEDLESYPRDRDGDRRKLEEVGASVAWFANREEFYPADFATTVRVPQLAEHLCGRRRPHHFPGVALVVTKLLNVVQPSSAYFGRKDYQQWRLIRRMVADLEIDTRIVGCPIVREPSGLAMSSRNLRLSPQGRERAATLQRGLQRGLAALQSGERNAARVIVGAAREILQQPELQLEYLELVDAEQVQPVTVVEGPVVLAVAAHIEGVRLIDNIEFSP